VNWRRHRRWSAERSSQLGVFGFDFASQLVQTAAFLIGQTHPRPPDNRGVARRAERAWHRRVGPDTAGQPPTQRSSRDRWCSSGRGHGGDQAVTGRTRSSASPSAVTPRIERAQRQCLSRGGDWQERGDGHGVGRRCVNQTAGPTCWQRLVGADVGRAAGGLFRGHLNPALDAVGEAEAHALGAELAQLLGGRRVVRIVSSPQRRAIQIRPPRRSRLALSAPPHEQSAQGLMDRDYGRWAAHSRQELEAQFGSVDTADGVQAAGIAAQRARAVLAAQVPLPAWSGGARRARRRQRCCWPRSTQPRTG